MLHGENASARSRRAGVVILAVMFVLAAAGSGQGQASQDQLEITFIGNAAFRISDGLLTLYSDFPYQPGYAGYMEYDFDSLVIEPGAFCLISHEHLDHFDPQGLLRMQDARVIADPAIADVLPAERRFQWGSSIRLRDVEIVPLATPHTEAHHSYLVGWRGLSLYFTGDTEDVDTLLAQRGLDIAFVTPWLASAVRDRGQRIDTELLVIYHHLPGEQVNAGQPTWQPNQGDSRTFPLAGAGVAR